MIIIRVTENKEGLLTKFVVSGHSGSAEHGHDLVCSAISSITFGLANAVDELIQESEIEIDENKITISIPHPNKNTEFVMRTGLIQLNTVEESYSQYVKIKMEV